MQWTAMGDGCVDLKTLFKEWRATCPETRFILKQFPVLPENSTFHEKGFWIPYSTIRADDFSRFLLLAQKGKPLKSFSSPPSVDPKKAQQEYQLSELERSLKFCREHLDLGRKST